MKKILLLLITLPIFSFSQSVLHPVKVSKPFVFDVTKKPLREMRGVKIGTVDRSWKKLIPNKIGFDRDQHRITDKSLQVIDESNIQYQMGADASAQDVIDWAGMPNIQGYIPPDTQGDVGLDHYVQVVNSSFQIWDKQGTSLYGPFELATIWQDFPGPWDTSLNDGDPIVLYDQEADRWLISEFSLPNYPNGPYYELIAISTTPDPTGNWYRYAYEYSEMPDYPHFGIWPDGYYMATNNFFRGAFFVGAGASCFERSEMLVGNPDARLIYINISDVPSGNEAASLLPADWDGVTPPPTGTPNYFTYFNDGTSDNLRLWEFSVDWDTPSNSTFTLGTTINSSAFDSNVGSISQPGTSQTLDDLADRLMYRFQYRNFGDYETMVANHTVDAGGRAGIKWYELNNTGSGWFLRQEGTYSPDSDNRWMGSLALDGNGNIALGYSVSSSSTYPSIRYTGRLKDDPLGEMTLAEREIVAGAGSQTGYSRWGDYAMMSIDPVDDATFWFTTEYYTSSSSGSWSTRIGAFSFGILADVKLFMQGAFNGVDGMTTNINSLLPLTSPYSEDPVTISSMPTDIVDWVLIQLKESSDGAVVTSKSALLRNDGMIVDPSSQTAKINVSVASGDYFIVVKHRNHMRIMSANAVSLPNATTYDFTTGSDKYFDPAGTVELD